MSTNFLWYPGTSNSGEIATTLALMTTELESVANNGVAVSSVGGTSGVFNNGNTGQAMLADLFWDVGNPGITGTLQVGACIAGWFLTSPDGTTFESGSAVPPRPPDFIIALPATAISAGAVYKASGGGPNGMVIIPPLPFKVLIQNNTGQTLAAGGTTPPYLKAALAAMQY